MSNLTTKLQPQSVFVLRNRRPCKYSGYRRVQTRRNELLFETVGGGPLETVLKQRVVCKTNDFENNFIIGNKIRIYFGHESLSNYANNVLVVEKIGTVQGYLLGIYIILSQCFTPQFSSKGKNHRSKK